MQELHNCCPTRDVGTCCFLGRMAGCSVVVADPLLWWASSMLGRGDSAGQCLEPWDLDLDSQWGGRPPAESAAHQLWSSETPALQQLAPYLGPSTFYCWDGRADIAKMCGLRSSGLLGLQMVQEIWAISVCLCFPRLPTIIFKYFSSTGRHIHTHTPHSVSVSHTHTKTHLTRRLLIYVPQHFQIFAFQVLNVCSSYRCFQIILILIAKAARRDRIF